MDGLQEQLVQDPFAGEPINSMLQTVITEQSVRDASDVLRKYKEGKQNLDTRVVKNEEWWRLRHWRQIKAKDGQAVDPSQDASSAWLLNGVLTEGGTVVCESANPEDVFAGKEELAGNFEILKQVRYGAAFVTLLRYTGAGL